MSQEDVSMPNRTIYVADADMPAFERAQELVGGNLSAAIAKAIKQFVEEQETLSSGYKEVTLKVGREVHSYQRFQGRLLVKGHVLEAEGERKVNYEVYQTPKGNLAVYARTMPAWYQWSGSQWGEWSRKQRKKQWGEDEWSKWAEGEVDNQLLVFSSLEELRAAVPPQIFEPVARILNSSGLGKDGVEVLDI